MTSSGSVTVTDADADKTFELAPGATLGVVLPASPTSGFDWEVTKAPAALGAVQKGFTEGGGGLGASGNRRLTWTLATGKSLPAGESSIELAYRRSFEEGKPPAKTFRFKVRAKR